MAIDTGLHINLDPLSSQGDKVGIFWRPKDRATIKAFNLYTDTDHTANPFSTLIMSVPNQPFFGNGYLVGNISVVLSREALGYNPTDVFCLKITTVDMDDVESDQADSPVRLILSALGTPASIAVSAIMQEISLPFVTKSFAAVNVGSNEVNLVLNQQTIQLAAGQSYDSVFAKVQLIQVYCSPGETTHIQIAGASV